MATKHFCDGCDKQIERPDDFRRVRVLDLANVGGEDVTNNPRDFELCRVCFSEFTSNHLPSTWHRLARPAA